MVENQVSDNQGRNILSFPASAGGGSGGGGSFATGTSLNIVRTTLSAAQINALGTTPAQIAPAPGAGFAIMPIEVILNYVYGGTIFTFTPSSLRVFWGGITPTNYFIGQSGLLDQLVNVFTEGGTFSLAEAASEPTSAVANQPLTISSDTTISGGNGSLIVTVVYAIIPVS